MLILSLAICPALSALAETPQNSANPDRVQYVPLALAPGVSYSTTPFPWETRPSPTTSQLDRLLTDLRNDIEAAAPAVAALNENIPVPQTVVADSAAMAYPSGDTVLPAKDLSTIVSQNLSVNVGQNLGQNLATSLAVPTSAPWSTWGNGPSTVMVNVGNGVLVAMPTFPPRTAWGNGPGVVVTTPGGAVFATTPPTAPVANANAEITREAHRQLSIVQDDLDHVLHYLATATNAVAPATAPSPSPSPVYLTPTGR